MNAWFVAKREAGLVFKVIWRLQLLLKTVNSLCDLCASVAKTLSDQPTEFGEDPNILLYDYA